MPETSAAHYAYKLATLFSSEEEIEAYLYKFATVYRPKDSKNFMHDACLFELPTEGRWKREEMARNLSWHMGRQYFLSLNRL